MQLVRLWGAFTKVEKQADGTLIVEGIASSDTVDSQGETVRPSAMQKAIPGYLRKDGSGPLREMHQPIAAGKTIAIDVQPDGKTYIVTKVVDASTVLKVNESVLQGFSIGGYVPPGGRNKDDPKVIETLVLQEISLVDRPANPDAVVTVFKLDGGEPARKADPPPAPGAQTDAGGAVQPGPHQSAAAGSTPAPPSPPAKAPVTPGTTLPPAAPPTAPSPAPPTPLEQPPTTVVPPPSSPTVPSPVPGAPATSPPPSSPPPPSPPSPSPLPPAEKVAKGMYSVQWAAEIISGLTSLVSDITWETNYEGDGSTIPARLKALCTELIAIFQDLVAEETAELVATMPDAEEPAILVAVQKPGALKKSERLAGVARSFAAAVRGDKPADSKAELRTAIAKAIDDLRAADVPTSDLQKSLDLANEAAAKAGEALKKVQGERDAIAKQLAEANAKLATKGALKVVAVDKKNDGGASADEDLEKLSPEEQIKKIHAKGGVPYGRAPLS